MFDNRTHSYSYKKKNNNRGLIVMGVFLVLILAVIIFISSLFSPTLITSEKRITIERGNSIISTGKILEDKGLVHSKLAFRLLAQSEEISIKSGQYIFKEGSQSLKEVVRRLSEADYGDVYERITIPEGSTNEQVAEAIKRSSFVFNEEEFNQLSQGTEGYLFPDTYNFLPDTDLEKIVATFRDNFDTKIEPLEDDIDSSGRTMDDIIIMASIIEKEATGNIDEKKIVSGILWKRLDEGRLLQVDAPFQYINGIVRAEDLREDGPYNTYTRAGLTPTPIGNPGIDSIIAAINPTSTAYYYYLHGKDGQIRYGISYDDHINNINRYLR